MTIINALSWNTVTTILRTALSLLRYALIVGRIAPGAVGLFALAKGLSDMFGMLADLGSNEALIVEDLSVEQRGSLYVTDLLIGAMIYLALWQAAPLLSVWHSADMTCLLRVMGLKLPLLALSRQQYLFLQKRMEWRFLGLLRVVCFAVGIIVLFVFQSLLLEEIVQAALSVALVCVVGSRSNPLDFRFRGEDLRSSLRFGVNKISRGAIVTVIDRMSNIIIARTFGVETVGVLSIARKLAFQVAKRINPIVTSLLIPAFSAIKSLREKEGLFLRIFVVLGIVNSVMSAAIILFAPVLFGRFFGAEWLPALRFGQILSLSAIAVSLQSLMLHFFVASGRLRMVWLFDVIGACLGLSVVMIAALCHHLSLLVWLQVAIAFLQVIGIYFSQFRHLRLRGAFLSGFQAAKREGIARVPVIRIARNRLQKIFQAVNMFV